MKKIIYFDCYMGISGDMTLGACLDLGVDAEELRRELAKLGVGGYRLEARKIVKNGFAGTDADVILEEQAHEDGQHSHAEQAHSHAEHGNHPHGEEHPHAHHHHRTLKTIREIIEQSGLKESVKETALNIFQVIAEAEAKVHGKDVEEVAFHEVGAVDSIVDICGAAICFDLLGVEAVYCSPLREGSGFIMCQHGELPVPVPAVMHMLPGSGIAIRQTEEIRTELVTPTGLGILKGTRAVCGPMPEMYVEQTGIGFGKRDTGRLNGLRAVLGTLV